MALINLLQLYPADSQQDIIDKSNWNWDQILSMGGGPPGDTGIQGIQGVPGSQGIQGLQGDAGADGNYWFVLPSTTTPTTPTPRENDLWLQTDTNDILQYTGSPLSWDVVGSLSVAGVFEEAGASNLVFTSPASTRSLVLSPIDYGAGTDSPGTVNYRLKVIGTSGNPIIKFGIDDGGSENNELYQPTISIQKVSGTDWTWNFDNNFGDIKLNLNGNYFGVIKQLSGVSAFEFNSQAKLQISSAHRLLSFSSSSLGNEFFHIGRTNGITTTSDRLFSMSDTGAIGLMDAFNNAVTGDATPSGFLVDQLHTQLTSAAVTQPWHRWRSKIDSTKYNELQLLNVRNFTEVGATPVRSAQIMLMHSADNTKYHGLSFTGGAKDSSLATRAQIRLTYGAVDAPYFSADVNGYIGIGDSTFIEDYNDSADADLQFKTRLNVLGANNTTMTGLSAFGGIHMFHHDATDTITGITAGGTGSNVNDTNAGLLFQADNDGVDLNILTSRYSGSGQVLRYTAAQSGNHHFWSRSLSTSSLIIEPGGQTVGTTDYSNDHYRISAYDTAGAKWKSILLAPATTTTGTGSGFIGVGGASGFGATITGPSSTLVVGEYYVAIGSATHNSIVYPDGVVFIAANTTLTSGTAAVANPQTKFHVNGAMTVGYRQAITSYSTNVGANSFTQGTNHKASGNRSVVLGGVGHTASSDDAIIIGYNGTAGIELASANKIALATNTYLSTSNDAPYFNTPNTSYTGANLFSIFAGDNIANGMEILLDVATNTGAPFLITSYSSAISPASYSTEFVVNNSGQVGIGGDPLSTTDPGMVASSIWTSRTARLTLRSTSSSNLVLDTTAPSTTAPTNATSTHITTSNRTGSSTGTILGKHLAINPGITRNINTASGAATGGSIYLRGGRGEENVTNPGTATTDTYGNVVLAYDIEDDVQAGSVVVGTGTPFSNLLIGRVRGTKTGASSGSASILAGSEFTTGTVTFTSGGMNIVLDFDNPFVTSNLAVISAIDSTSNTHYAWTCLCTARSATSITIFVGTNDGSAWSAGSVDFSFTAYCL